MGSKDDCATGGKSFHHRCSKLKDHQATCNKKYCATHYCEGDYNDADFRDWPMQKTTNPYDKPHDHSSLEDGTTSVWCSDMSTATYDPYSKCPSCCVKNTPKMNGFLDSFAVERQTRDRGMGQFGGPQFLEASEKKQYYTGATYSDFCLWYCDPSFTWINNCEDNDAGMADGPIGGDDDGRTFGGGGGMAAPGVGATIG